MLGYSLSENGASFGSRKGYQAKVTSIKRRSATHPEVVAKPSANFFALPLANGESPSILTESRPAGLVMAGNRFLNQCRMNGSSTRTRIRCAALRHAEMPKGSRRAPNVYRRVHSRPRHTAQWVGLIKRSLYLAWPACPAGLPRRSLPSLLNLTRCKS